MILNKEYPAPSPTTGNLIVSVLFGAFITFFLFFFEPFDIQLSEGKSSLTALMFYGVITSFVLFIFLYLLPLTFPKVFTDSRWKVKHQIVFCTTLLFVIATLNGLYTNYVNSLSFTWSNYWWIINRTFVLGSIPFSFIILLDVSRRENLNKQEASSILSKQTEEDASPRKSHVTTINTDLKSETFDFDDRHFIYAEAVGNYTDLYFLQADQTSSQTYRVSLSAFELQLDASNLKRCHRSYLADLNKVTKVSGNAQGLKLTFSGSDSVVPVSRKYIPIVKEFFAKTA